MTVGWRYEKASKNKKEKKGKGKKRKEKTARYLVMGWVRCSHG